MKKVFTLVAILLIASSAFAQNFPEAFNYQAVIRRTDGSLIVDKKIGLQIGIAEDSIAGKVVYSEKHFVKTNKYGLVEVEVGRGAADNGKFSNLVWGGKRHFIRIGFSEDASANFNFMGTSELLSSPYAHYAKHSGDALTAGSGIKIENGVITNTGAAGTQGPKGDKGEPGTKGDKGDTGLTGAQGIKGDNGTKGDKGDTGLTGAQGIQGTQGIQGVKGDKGEKGDTGWVGPLGLTGPVGPAGPKGDQGIAGPIGPVGPSGGPVGPQGIQGVPGPAGSQGLQGATGPVGPQGLQGATGAVGPQGLQGLQGVAGPAGPQGATGLTGATGPAGTYTAGTGISITGSTISNTGDLSNTNEIQTLSVSGSNLTLSNGGGTVALPSGGGFWSANGSSIYKNNSGNVGIGTTSPSNLLTIESSQASFGNTQRDFIFINNTASGQGTYAGMTMKTGNSGQTYITQHDASYGISGYENFGQVTSTGSGFIVRAGSTSGVLKFQTGFSGAGISDTKMFIASQGNIGIGNENPTAKLQVTSGDVYIDTVSSGVIMKSPNGSCWRMTVSNTGLPVFTAITCP